MTCSFQFSLIGYLTLDVCVGMNHARLLGWGHQTNINVSFSNHATVQYCKNSRLIGMIRCMNYFAALVLIIW